MTATFQWLLSRWRTEAVVVDGAGSGWGWVDVQTRSNLARQVANGMRIWMRWRWRWGWPSVLRCATSGAVG